MVDMKHMEYLHLVSKEDVYVLRKKESTYLGSWKAAGGRSAWFMLRRNMDRLLNMLQPPKCTCHFSLSDLDDAIAGAGASESKDCTLDSSVVQYLRDCHVSEDVFAQIEAEPSGADGTVLAVMRDMRRYCILVEAEMMARGAVASVARQEDVHAAFVSAVNVSSKEWQCAVASVQESGERPKMLETEHRSTLSRAAEIERDFYHLKSQETTVDEKTIRAAVELVMAQIAADAQRDVRLVPRFERVTSDADALHANLTPWMVSTRWRFKHDMNDGGPHDATFNKFWRQYTSGTWVLETFVPDAETPLPRQLVGMYRSVKSGWVIDVATCPPEVREHYPQLRAGINGLEFRSLEEWQRDLYEWDSERTEYALKSSANEWLAPVVDLQ